RRSRRHRRHALPVAGARPPDPRQAAARAAARRARGLALARYGRLGARQDRAGARRQLGAPDLSLGDPVTDAIDRTIARHGPDAVCRALAPLLTAERIARIDEVIAARLGSVVAAVEDTHDPHNAAATIRTSEALGLQELHVIEPGERFSAARGVTRGAHRWI